MEYSTNISDTFLLRAQLCPPLHVCARWPWLFFRFFLLLLIFHFCFFVGKKYTFKKIKRAASTSRRVNRITWTVPVPTALGLDPTVLQAVAKERELGESQNSRHARQGFRRVAVTNFNGLPQVHDELFFFLRFFRFRSCFCSICFARKTEAMRAAAATKVNGKVLNFFLFYFFARIYI